MDRARLLSVAELRPAYERLARLGVLFGQPVDLGPFGGLRVAIGAQTLLDGSGEGDLARVFATLERGCRGTDGSWQESDANLSHGRVVVPRTVVSAYGSMPSSAQTMRSRQ